MFTIGALRFLCISRAFFDVIGDPALSLLFAHVYFVLQNRQWKAFLHLSPPCRVLKMISSTTCGIPFWICRADKQSNCSIRRRKSNWPKLNFLVILPLIYSATKKVLMILHDATLVTIACGVFIVVRHPCHQTLLVTTKTRQSGPSSIAWR